MVISSFWSRLRSKKAISCVASSEPAIQGSLFAAEEDPKEDLKQDFDAVKPRRRSHPGSKPLASKEHIAAADSSNELPPWHHHSLVDPAALPPMLRHYVELKAAHPERILLYRLGDFFECFFV